jgi:hypothetical protein
MMRVLVTMGMLMMATAAVAGERCGDADGNGTVGVTDGVQALRAAASLPSSCTPGRCDVNDDGAVTVTDGVNVLRDAAGLAPVLTCPGASPGCSSATVSVALDVPQPIGAAVLTVGYPATVVTLPGSGEAAAERVTLATPPGALLNDGEPNDLEDRVVFSLVAFDGVGDGPLLSVRFDCLAAAPAAAAFDCALTDVFATDGATPVAGATCTAGVASD